MNWYLYLLFKFLSEYFTILLWCLYIVTSAGTVHVFRFYLLNSNTIKQQQKKAMQNTKTCIYIFFSLSNVIYVGANITRWDGLSFKRLRPKEEESHWGMVCLFCFWQHLKATQRAHAVNCTPLRPAPLQSIHCYSCPLSMSLSEWSMLWTLLCPPPHHLERKHKSTPVISFVCFSPHFSSLLLIFCLFLSFAPFCSSRLSRCFGLLKDPDVFRRLWQQERREAEALALPAPWPPASNCGLLCD